MGRTLQTLVAVGAVTLMAGCDGRQVAQDPPVKHTPSFFGSSTTAPVMPALAKRHTKAGAKAFIVYVWRVIDYATETLSAALVEPLMSPTCAPCQAGIDGIRRDAEQHAVVRGGANTLSDITVKEFWVAGRQEMLVAATVHNAEQVITPASPASPTTYPAQTTATSWRLRATADGWIVSEWNPRA